MGMFLLTRTLSLALLLPVLRLVVSSQFFAGAEDLVALSATVLAASLSLIGHTRLHSLLKNHWLWLFRDNYCEPSPPP